MRDILRWFKSNFSTGTPEGVNCAHAATGEAGWTGHPPPRHWPGIEGTKIFRRPEDREDFLTRVGTLCDEGAWRVYAWALLENHFHLLVRSGACTWLRTCGLALAPSEPGAFPTY